MELSDHTEGSNQFCFHLQTLIPVSTEAFYVVIIMQTKLGGPLNSFLATKVGGLHVGAGETSTD